MRVHLGVVVRALPAALVVALMPAASAAQTPAPVTDEHDFTRCSIVGVLSGLSVASSEAGATVGGIVGWPLTAHVGLEVAAAWSDRPNDGSAFAAGL